MADRLFLSLTMASFFYRCGSAPSDDRFPLDTGSSFFDSQWSTIIEGVKAFEFIFLAKTFGFLSQTESNSLNFESLVSVPWMARSESFTGEFKIQEPLDSQSASTHRLSGDKAAMTNCSSKRSTELEKKENRLMLKQAAISAAIFIWSISPDSCGRDSLVKEYFTKSLYYSL